MTAITGRAPAERTAHGLRRDVILDRMQADHEQAGHAEGDVRDCPICLTRYGLDGPFVPRVGGAPRSWWAGREADDGLDPDADRSEPDDTELEEMG